MYVLKDSKTINENKIINEINNIAIKNLKMRFIKLNIETIEINNIKKEVKKISRDLNNQRKIMKLKLFLLNHSSEYKEKNKNPSNLFSKDCGIILKIIL